MNTPQVSIVMPVYNGAKYLSETLESIFTQTYNNFELIVVNDSSTDDSLTIIKSYNDLRVRIINNIENMGQTSSLNVGVRHSQGKYIAIQDQDDISLPNRIEKQVNFLRAKKEIIVLGTNGYIIDSNGKQINLFTPFYTDSYALKLGLIFNVQTIIHSSVMFNKKIIYNEFKGYHQGFKFYQDYDLWSRVVRKYKIMNLSDKLIKHRLHHSSASKLNLDVCNNEAVSICISNLSYYLSNISLDKAYGFSFSLYNYKPKILSKDFYKILSRTLSIFYQKNEMSIKTDEVLTTISKKVVDIYAFDRVFSFKVLLLFRKYMKSKKVMKLINLRIILLWLGLAEIRKLCRFCISRNL
ncbi:MAG TPA: glycosyltransferase [Victivallales bacterium]|nr:glycosyltransferase [Victivallales bacterium]